MPYPDRISLFQNRELMQAAEELPFQVVMAGTNHKTSPLEFREKLSIAKNREAPFLQYLLGEPTLFEAVAVSTCNRTEVYAATELSFNPVYLSEMILDFHGLEKKDPRQYMYTSTGREAVLHLFEVASSLDSLVVGEGQINQQVKTAYSASKKAGATGPALNLLFQRCFKAAKAVYATTGIASNKVSVSSVGVDLVSQVMGDLCGKQVLIIGSGKTGKLSAVHFRELGVSEIYFANRTPARAEKLANELGAKAVPLKKIDSLMPEVDVVVGCTSAKEPFLHRERASHVLKARGGKPLFILDLGVPRNIDPGVGKLDGIYLYDIDQLGEMAEINLATRKECAEMARELLLGEVETTMQQLAAADRKELVSNLLSMFEDIRTGELERTLSKIDSLPEKDASEIDYLTKRIIRKIMHTPLTRLKTTTDNDERARIIETIRSLFS